MVQAAAPHTQEALPYAFDALAPHIDALTMEIHHGKHHAAYIKNLNAALEGKADLAAKSIEDLVIDIAKVEDAALQTTIRNNGGGHWNHAFFWETLAPADKSGKPSDELAKAIDAAFGSMDAFKTTFGEAATKRFGSGWAWLIVKDGKLAVTSTPNQDNPLMKELGRGESRNASPRTRCLGTRLLSQLPEPPPRLHRRLVEHRELGQSFGPVCEREVRGR